MNASETALESAAEACERWSWGCGCLVVVGLIVELALAVVQPSPNSFWAIWGPRAADVFVVVGVAGEILFSRMGFSRQRELGRLTSDALAAAIKQASEANERAANAERETERLRAQFGQRSLSPSQIGALIIALNRNPGNVRLLTVSGDVESTIYAGFFMFAFTAAGWSIKSEVGPVLAVTFGIRVPTLTGRGAAPSHAVQAAFRAAGLEFEDVAVPTFGITFSGNRPSDRASDADAWVSNMFADGPADLYIGPRPIPHAVIEE